ncbi:MAG: TolC family protein [Candidatus Aminicenantales bacterium]
MKNAGRFVLLLILVLGFHRFVFSEETLMLTLEESVRLALAQNPFYLASQEKVEGATSMLREAASSFFPTLDAQGLHTLDEKLFVLEFPSMIPGQPAQRISIDFTKDYQFALSFAWPLYAGGRLVSGYKQAKYNYLSTEETARQSRDETVFNVKKTFFGYLLAKKFIEVSEEAVALAEKHFQNVKNLYEVGMASKFDLLRSEVQVANLRPQLIRAKNGLNLAELSLKTVVGLDLNKPIEVKGELTFKSFDADIEECVVQALLNRPEISQFRYQRQMAQEMLKIARAANLPSLAIAGSYNFWADKFNFTKDAWQSYYSVNLVMTFPIFNGFATSARVGQTKALIRELDYNQKGLLEMIKFEVRQAVLNLKQAKESLLSQEKNVEQALEAVRIAELNYAEGLATSLDVSSAQVALTQAKTNYSQALYDYVISIAQLEKAVGTSRENNE